MTKVLKCGDVVPGCNFEMRGNSEDEVLKKANEHAKSAHNMHNMSPEVLNKIRAAIRKSYDYMRLTLDECLAGSEALTPAHAA